MEVEKLVNLLRGTIDAVRASRLMDDYFDGDFESMVKVTLNCPIQLNPHRTIATACKILASDPTIPDGQRLAGALMQMTGAGDAKPYEVCDE